MRYLSIMKHDLIVRRALGHRRHIIASILCVPTSSQRLLDIICRLWYSGLQEDGLSRMCRPLFYERP